MMRWGQNDIKFRCTGGISKGPVAEMEASSSFLSAEIRGLMGGQEKSGYEIRYNGSQTMVTPPVFELWVKELTLAINCDVWWEMLLQTVLKD